MKRLLASCLGLGRLPVAPGTWGSLPPVFLFVLLCHLGWPGIFISATMVVLAVVGAVVCVTCAPAAIAATGKDDPREVVADEFAGQALTFAAVGTVAIDNLAATALLGLVVFRVFDIFKPWPARRLEKLPAGWGILADDLMAGAYAGAVLLIAVRIGPLHYVSEWLRANAGSLSTSSAAFLGVVQGLTEFLPVSSSGHLVLLEKLFNFNPETPQMLLFDLAVHLGTVIAILIVFHKSAVSFVKNLVAFDKYGAGKTHTASSKEASQGTGASGRLKTTFRIYRKNPAVRLLVLAFCATVVTGVSGLALKEQFVRARGSLRTVACMWVITGTLLVVTDVRRGPRLGLRQFSAWHAVIVGLAQAAAILPGISRSGVTICAAILLGLRRRWAVEFSFLLAVPAILGAATYEFLWEFRQSGLGALGVTPLLVGIITAAATGTIALKVLLNAARNANLKVFGFYCYILAAFVLIYLLW